jgi:mRNA-degrading endonuclease toxin of MazEF toxin-antitoxin module
VIIMAEEIRTVREVSIDKSKRHVSSSTIQEVD